MSELRKQFERLIEFAKQNEFYKPFSQVYLVEDNKKYIYRETEIRKISRKGIFTIDSYENRFEELLKQKHSWINMNFTGMIGNDLIVFIEMPKHKNNAKYTSVNLSGPTKK